MSGVEELYPFLYERGDPGSTRGHLATVLAELARSTRDKIVEIERVRGELLAAQGERIGMCAEEMARSFTDRGRLFSFGNGGSSTDAQAIAELSRIPVQPAGRCLQRADQRCRRAQRAGQRCLLRRGLRPAAGRQRPRRRHRGGLVHQRRVANVLRGFEEANRRGMLTIGLAGYDGGKMARRRSRQDRPPVRHALDSVHRIQEAQTTIYHVLWELVQLALAQ